MKTQATFFQRVAWLGCLLSFWVGTSLYAQVPVLDEWAVPVTGVVGNGENFSLEFGKRTGATDGFDTGIDAASPPVVPGGSDSYFFIPIFPNRLARDFRNPAETPKNWTLRAVDATGFGNNTFSWDTSNFPTGDIPGVLTISSPAIGTVDMLTQTSVTFTGTQQFTIHFEAPIVVQTPEISIADVSQNENVGTMSFTVSLSTTSSSPVSVDYATANGTAIAPGDYASANGTLTIPAGSTTGTINVAIVNDALDENDETFTVNLSNPVNATIADAQGVGTIIDNDDPPSLSIGDASVNENAGPMVFTVSLSAASGKAISVDFATANGTAVAPDDYTATNGTLNIPAGSTSGTISVPIINDVLAEGNETFTVNLSNAINATILDAQGVGTIIDNDVVSVAIGDASANESAGTMNFTVTLSTTSSSPVSVNYATANGTAIAPGDYTATNGTLTIPAGSTTGTINVLIINDLLDENDETFTVNLSNPVNATITDAQGVGTIIDNDDPPSLSVGDASVNENAGPMSFTVSLSSASGKAISVNFATANGTAIAPGDYTSTNGTLNIPAGSTTGTINVVIVNDALDENDETFTVNLSNPVNATIADAQGVGTILDDDQPPSLSIGDASVNESAGPMIFTVSLSAASGKAISVDFATANGTAVAPDDYTATNGTLNIPAGSTSGTISVPIINDVLDEVNETFTVNLSNAVNATILDAQGVGTIVDNDGASIAIGDASANEDAGTMSFTVTLSVASASDVSVNYATANGTAVAPGDYTATNGTLTIPAGNTTGTINVAIINDLLDENDETFTVNLSGNPDITDGQGVGTIIDNDDPPSLSVGDASVNENAGPMSFTVSLSAASGKAISVDFATANGTAIAPGDYTSTNGTLNIPAGSTTGTINVVIVNDALDENDETFTINLSNPVNATIADAQGVGTIIDDDAMPTLSINDASVNEGAGPMIFTVSLSAASGKAISVDFATANGTAVAPDDYTATNGTLNIPAGSTSGTISVPIIDDVLEESAETFTVNLSNPVNATIADNQGVGTIDDNDGVVFCALSVDPTSFDFGGVDQGSFADKTFILSNTANATTNCTGSASIIGDPEFTIVSGANFNIPPGGTHNLVVRFDCQQKGGDPNAILRLSSSTVIDVPLTGDCVPGLLANFSATRNVGVFPLTTTFTATSSQVITHYRWHFGDGTESTEASPTHTYNAPGRYTVSLTVNGPSINFSTSKAAYIWAYQCPGPVALNFVSGSTTFPGEGWDNAIDGDTDDWDGTVTVRGNPPQAIFGTPGSAIKRINKVRVLLDTNTPAQARWATQLTVQVSTTGTASGDFTGVFTQNLSGGAWHNFEFPAVEAKFVRIRLNTPNPQADGWVQLGEFEVWEEAQSVVSTANSSISATSPHLANGIDASTITINLRNAANAPVSGLASDAFNVAASGSRNTLTAVTESATPGTYTARLTSLTAESKTITVFAQCQQVGTATVTFGTAALAKASLSFVAGSFAWPGEEWDNAIDGDLNGWDGTVTSQGNPPFGIFSFSDLGTRNIGRVRLIADTQVGFQERWVTKFRIAVSTTGTDDADFTTVLEAIKSGGGWQSYDFSLAPAKYIKIMLDEPVSADWVQLGELEVYAEATLLARANSGEESTPAADAQVPKEFSLSQNYPNPFNPETMIRFGLPVEAPVRLTIYDLQGRMVRMLVDQAMPAGEHEMRWDGNDANGMRVSSGVYLYRIEAGTFTQVKRMTLMK